MSLRNEDLARFFLIVPPGLENAAQLELSAWFSSAKVVSRERGGLEIEAPLGVGLALPRRLKVPSRVLWRLSDFGCRDFPKLFKKVRALPWADWLPDGAVVEFEASAHASRLRIKKRISETAQDGVRAALRVAKAPAGPKRAPLEPLMAYARFQDDVCWLSLDLSGEHQHRRGVKTLGVDAPLRENAAAGFLWSMAEPSEQKSDDARPIELIDPMCGSGTFSVEALGLRDLNSSRAFAFERLRPVAEKTWSEIAPDGDLSRVPRFERARLSDALDRAVEAARGNLKSAGIEERASIEVQDVFEGEPLAPVAEGLARWLVVNPPYGERLRASGSPGERYSHLADRLEAWARPDRVGLLLPAKITGLKWPRAWRALGEPIEFSNGGIPTSFFRFYAVRASAR